MIHLQRISRLVSASMFAMLCTDVVVAEQPSVLKPLLTKRVDPKEFGTQDDTITVIPASSFVAIFPGNGYEQPTHISPSFGRSAQPGLIMEYYASLEIPAGAIIDFIGLNSTTDTDAILGIALWQRARYAGLTQLVGFSVPAHNWDTDFAGPLNIQLADRLDKEYVLNVEQASSPNLEFFAWVEVRWHRTVSPAPGAPTFNDVPVSDPAFQYVEALVASGITAGCGGGNYCPDAPLTRRQMAVFLSKALGLHWPN